MISFGQRLQASFERYGNLCVGIDPHSWLLREWGLEDSPAGAREFGLSVVGAATGRVGVIKPQVAFYERFGAPGYSALEDVLAAAREAGLMVIADTKRGDVGTTMESYGRAWLSPGGTLESDAMTAHPFHGVESLRPVFDFAERNGKGVFVLCATSNPEAAGAQRAVTPSGLSTAADVARDVSEWNQRNALAGTGSIGLVIGATVDARDYGIDLASLRSTPILAPGFGHQGARFEELPERYGVAASLVLANVSRSVLSAGPEGLAAAIAAQAEEVAACRA